MLSRSQRQPKEWLSWGWKPLSLSVSKVCGRGGRCLNERGRPAGCLQERLGKVCNNTLHRCNLEGHRLHLEGHWLLQCYLAWTMVYRELKWRWGCYVMKQQKLSFLWNKWRKVLDFTRNKDIRSWQNLTQLDALPLTKHVLGSLPFSRPTFGIRLSSRTRYRWLQWVWPEARMFGSSVCWTLPTNIKQNRNMLR
jgi:hypothetical protein